jgi:plasmid stabilization system protein ParE
VIAPKAAVKFTANFEANLTSIEAFCRDQQAPQTYARLLEDLEQTVIRDLEEHPAIGRRFFARSPQSAEVKSRVAALKRRLGATEIREYLSGDYLLLYSVRPDAGRRRLVVHLLTIRHHRQMSFDFEGFWQAPRGDDT